MKMLDRTLIGEKIKKRRCELGMKQAQLAKDLDVSRGTVSNWESGTRFPNTEMLGYIADCLEVSFDYFLVDLKQEENAKQEENTSPEEYPITLQKIADSGSNNTGVNDLVKLLTLSVRLTAKEFAAVIAMMEAMVEARE